MQALLFDRGEARIQGFGTTGRQELGAGAWVEHVQGFLSGQLALFDALHATTAWTHQRRRMYDRVVDVPRLLGRPPRNALIEQVVDTLDERYGWRLDHVGAALYRDGNDSVAWHGDRMGPLRADCVIAVLCLGSERRFLLRPAGGGASRAIRFVGGDLIVMGGTAQETWEHCVPKCRGAGPRIALMFRPGPT
jgi:alkylated DNA repair dioxygenase AlkB